MSRGYLDQVPTAVRERAARIRLLGLDVDGTLTDGRLHLDSSGGESKSFHALDGQGIKLVQAIGIEVALITARRSTLVAERAAELGITRVHQACHDKRAALQALCAETGISEAEAAFMGDDLPDLPALRLVGLAVVPASAHPWLVPYAHWVTERAGGGGAVRELCDLILQAQGQAAAVLQRFAGP